jgi:pimeloyl-ACP methyl ester carboxylesterase
MECQLDRITVHYEMFGEGKPVVMLHGMPLDHTEMIYEMERHFAKRPGWKRIYPDMPGHGKTPGADWITSTDQILKVVEDFIDKVIPAERFVLACTSYGAYIGRGLVYHKWRQIDGLLLCVPVIIPDRAKRTSPPRAILVKDQSILDAAKLEKVGLLEEGAVVQCKAVLDYARALQATVANERFLERIWPQSGFSFCPDKLPQPFPAPSLFIMGRQDHWVGYRDAWGVLENYPRATFVVLDRAGHLALGEQSKLCSALVNEWLDRVQEWVAQPHL